MSQEQGRRMPMDKEALIVRNGQRRYFLNRSEALLESYRTAPHATERNPARTTPLVAAFIDGHPTKMRLEKRVYPWSRKITKCISIVAEGDDSKPHTLFNIIQVYSYDSQKIIKTVILNESNGTASNDEVANAVANLNSIATGLMGLKR